MLTWFRRMLTRTPAAQAVLTFLIFLPFVDRRRTITVTSDDEFNPSSSFCIGEETNLPRDRRTRVVESDSVCFDIHLQKPPHPPRSDADKWASFGSDTCVEVSPRKSGFGSQVGSNRGKRPSLVLRPKLHPTLSTFRSPVSDARDSLVLPLVLMGPPCFRLTYRGDGERQGQQRTHETSQ